MNKVTNRVAEHGCIVRDRHSHTKVVHERRGTAIGCARRSAFSRRIIRITCIGVWLLRIHAAILFTFYA
jgi:hypothetical protein